MCRRRDAPPASAGDRSQPAHVSGTHQSWLFVRQECRERATAAPAVDTVVAMRLAVDSAPAAVLAVTRKIPSSMHWTISSKPAAHLFVREAQQVALTDQEWAQAVDTLRRLLGERCLRADGLSDR